MPAPTRSELVVEVAGPGVLANVGEQVLRQADLWTTSGAALADEALLQRLESTGRSCGHRLRILPGAFAGLDGVAAAAAAPGTTLGLTIELLPGPAPAGPRFAGSVREAARAFPNDVNVAVAAALAGPGRAWMRHGSRCATPGRLRATGSCCTRKARPARCTSRCNPNSARACIPWPAA